MGLLFIRRWRYVSNQLISLASREKNINSGSSYSFSWEVSNQLISLASREV